MQQNTWKQEIHWNHRIFVSFTYRCICVHLLLHSLPVYSAFSVGENSWERTGAHRVAGFDLTVYTYTETCFGMSALLMST